MTPLEPDGHVVVVGAGLSGWRLSEGLRHHGFQGDITLVGAEHHLPYDRPPLSKQVMSGKWEPDSTGLTPTVSDSRIHLRLGVAAVALDTGDRRVVLADGDVLDATCVVLACGLRARRLSTTAGDEVHVLRTLDDATQLIHHAHEKAAGSSVAVIGGGFIGAEVATSLVARGLRPVVLESMERPLISVLGDGPARWVEALPAAAGVELRGSQEVLDIEMAPGGVHVTLGDGSSLDAAFAVAGIGAIPNTEWLTASGLLIDDGVVVDEFLRAAEGIYAIGDIANFQWTHPPFTERTRLEHWQVATDHAAYLARSLTSSDKPEPIAMVPYFWSDQYGAKLQVLGHPASSDRAQIVWGSVEERRFLVVYERSGVVSGLLGLSAPRALMKSRELLEHHVEWDDAMARSPWAS